MNTLSRLSDFWNAVQLKLFPFLEEALPETLEFHRRCIAILELVKIEKQVPSVMSWRGRPQANRIPIARAFVIKSVLNITSTVHLRERLLVDITLRRICGWESVRQVPSESTLCRAFEEFTQAKLPERVHEVLVRQVYENSMVGHLSRDSTDIPAREKSKKRKKQKDSTGKKNGGPRSKGAGKCEKQLGQTVGEMLSEISVDCDFGSKTSAKGHRYNWIGYKLHADVADGSIPISCRLTSASVNDCLLAIPMSTISGERVSSFYEVMDKGYYVDAICQFIESKGRKALISKCPKSTQAKEEAEKESLAQSTLKWKPADLDRLKHRTEVERFYSNLKDNFAGRMIRVKGPAKVFCHLMFSVLALTASQLLRLIC